MAVARVPESIDELRSLCQQGPNWEVHQPWGFKVMRRASIYLTWLLLHTPITANGVTILGILLAIAGGVLFGMTHFVSGALTIFLAAVADFSDGEVSRYRKQQSKQGSFLDKVYHSTAHSSVFAGLAIGAYRIHPSLAVIALGFVATIGASAFSIAVGYGNELAVWKHSRKLIEMLNRAMSSIPPDRAALEALIMSAREAPVISVGDGPARPRLAVRLAEVVGYWDFPYIFWTIILAVFVHGVAGAFTTRLVMFTAFDVVLVFYAATYPMWIGLYVVHVLATRATERGYSHFTTELSMLLYRTRQVAREAPRK